MACAHDDPASALTVWTIGHSTRPIEEFLGLLATLRIDTIVDVRRSTLVALPQSTDKPTITSVLNHAPPFRLADGLPE